MNTSSKKKKRQPEGQEGKIKGVKEVNVPREKGRLMLKATEGLRKVTIGKCPLDLVVRGWWHHQLRCRER